MRTIKNSFGSLAAIGGLIASLNLVHAQTTAKTVQSVSADDLAVMLQAMEATTPVPAESVPTWNLGDGLWLLNDLDQPQTQTQAMRMAAFDLDRNSGGDDSPTYSFPTNGLWLELTGISNELVYLNLHNATDEVYEVVS
jgi:hypothetical protein